MRRRPAAAVALAATLALAGCAVGYQPTAPERSEAPTNDHLGYHDGYWYNDTFDIDAAEGLTEAEKRAVFSRAIARVQLLRELRFEDDVEIDIVTRAEFRAEFDDVWPEPDEDRRTIDNAQHEALFLVGPDEDVVDVRRANQGGTVLGFYQPGAERIVIVSGNDPATLDDELTLAHELLHALQDQRFGLGPPGSTTLDAVNARNGLIEGDAVAVERAYERNCETGEWQCVDVGTGSGGSLPAEFHWGVYFVGFFPYAEGPSFVEHHRDAGGWDAVDAIYDDYPATSAEIIRPETYDSDVYGEATVRDRTGGGWERVTVGDDSTAATVGRAGLASMFAYTAYAGDSPGVIDRDAFRNAGSDGLDPDQPYTYDVPYTGGWYGDRLHAYERDGETAYVWNVTFDDADDAAAFREGYERVAEHWGGDRDPTAASETRFRFGDSSRFDGAVRVDREDNAVTVVRAPSIAALGDVYAPAAAPAPTADSALGDARAAPADGGSATAD